MTVILDRQGTAETNGWSHMSNVSFKSKLDGWLVWLVLAIVFLPPLLIAWKTGQYWVLLWMIPADCLVLAIMYGLYRQTHYTITDQQLLIRSGPISIKIPLSEITRIEPTRSALSSPAWSLDRLAISYSNGRRCMISPENKQNFLRALRERGVAAAA